MEIWTHGGNSYELSSGYSLPDNARRYELAGLTGPPGAGPFLAVSIPDATPTGPFTPMRAEHVTVHAGGGTLPWPILEKLTRVPDLSDEAPLSAEETALPLSLDVWTFGTRRYEVNHFHDEDAWRYELYEVDTGATGNNYIDVRIPDASPDYGPFVPMPSDHVTLTMHGRWTLAWPVFRRFLEAIRTAGDIVESVGGESAPGTRV